METESHRKRLLEAFLDSGSSAMHPGALSQSGRHLSATTSALLGKPPGAPLLQPCCWRGLGHQPGSALLTQNACDYSSVPLQCSIVK